MAYASLFQFLLWHKNVKSGGPTRKDRTKSKGTTRNLNEMIELEEGPANNQVCFWIWLLQRARLCLCRSFGVWPEGGCCHMGDIAMLKHLAHSIQ